MYRKLKWTIYGLNIEAQVDNKQDLENLIKEIRAEYEVYAEFTKEEARVQPSC